VAGVFLASAQHARRITGRKGKINVGRGQQGWRRAVVCRGPAMDGRVLAHEARRTAAAAERGRAFAI